MEPDLCYPHYNHPEAEFMPFYREGIGADRCLVEGSDCSHPPLNSKMVDRSQPAHSQPARGMKKPRTPFPLN